MDKLLGKISIIVPVYNVEKYLERCVKSILNQTYKDLEIILVNDGSTDLSGAICDRFALIDQRIHVIHKSNGGLSDARNVGLENAKGEYISFIDSDDFIHVGFCEALLSLAIEHNADIVQCEFQKVYESELGEFDKKTHCSLKTEEIISVNNIGALKNLFNENYLNTVVVWNKLYKRDLFNNVRFPKGKIHEDEFTTYKVLYNSLKIVITLKKMYFYLQRSDSIMGQKFNVNRLDVIEAYSNQLDFYHDKGLVDLKEKAMLRYEILIRGNMIKVLKSDLENKEYIFRDLISQYRSHYLLFKENQYFTRIKRKIIYLFNFSPIFFIKLTCRFLELRLNVIGFLKKGENQSLL